MLTSDNGRFLVIGYGSGTSFVTDALLMRCTGCCMVIVLAIVRHCARISETAYFFDSLIRIIYVPQKREHLFAYDLLYML